MSECVCEIKQCGYCHIVYLQSTVLMSKTYSSLQDYKLVGPAIDVVTFKQVTKHNPVTEHDILFEEVYGGSGFARLESM